MTNVTIRYSEVYQCLVLERNETLYYVHPEDSARLVRVLRYFASLEPVESLLEADARVSPKTAEYILQTWKEQGGQITTKTKGPINLEEIGL